MVEFHVDDFDLLHQDAEASGFGAFGGNLSVQKPPNTSKPLMIFGQDESVYSQFLVLGNQQWVGPQARSTPTPSKD
jgi:hypothetical protein